MFCVKLIRKRESNLDINLLAKAEFQKIFNYKIIYIVLYKALSVIGLGNTNRILTFLGCKITYNTLRNNKSEIANRILNRT